MYGRAPKDPRDRPYQVEPVRFVGGSGVTLAGELIIQRTGGPFKAIV